MLADKVWAPQRGRAVDDRPPSERRPAAARRRHLHYAKGLIRSLGVVTAPARTAPRPKELPQEPWSEEGYIGEVEYHDAPTPIALEEIPTEWRLADGGPFTRHGGVKQGYLFPLSAGFVKRFRNEFQARWPELDHMLRQLVSVSTFAEFMSWGTRLPRSGRTSTAGAQLQDRRCSKTAWRQGITPRWR